MLHLANKLPLDKAYSVFYWHPLTSPCWWFVRGNCSRWRIHSWIFCLIVVQGVVLLSHTTQSTTPLWMNWTIRSQWHQPFKSVHSLKFWIYLSEELISESQKNHNLLHKFRKWLSLFPRHLKIKSPNFFKSLYGFWSKPRAAARSESSDGFTFQNLSIFEQNQAQHRVELLLILFFKEMAVKKMWLKFQTSPPSFSF